MSDSPTVRQISVFIANEAGRVSEVTGLLGDAGVNIRGFSVSDTIDYGILRLVVDKPDEALATLRGAGFTVREDPVICIDLPDRPGGLAGVLRIVAEAGVNIEYVYSLVATFVVINVADVDQAVQMLGDRPIRLVSQDDIARPPS
ncbi:MAG: ACT domain-containing protein [Actinobacteria bacterium]|nr:ACT domain-containing protein [Actinomycetota bacterium]